MRVLGIRGMSVTMPHKEAVIGRLDRLDAAARRLGAVNCITREGDDLVGLNTDGAGFLAALAADGIEAAGTAFVVVGAGGAARAVVLALAEAGARSVVVLNRSAERGDAAAALAGAAGATASPAEAAAAIARADVLVNATPLGMQPGDPLPVPADALRPGLHVAELIYHPPATALVAAAIEAGATASNGLGMLVHQAALAFEAWTGMDAPLAEMVAAAS
jgi:shikimate dehydrogenase